jgi:hypothetical protein
VPEEYDEPLLPGIEEADIENRLLTMMAVAKTGIEQGSIEELNRLRDYAFSLPPERVPIEVQRFIVSFKRNRGRMRDRPADVRRFWRDPNRVAAFLAMQNVRALRRAFPRRYKVTLAEAVSALPAAWIQGVEPDSMRRTIRATAVLLAVRYVNRMQPQYTKLWERPAREHVVGGELPGQGSLQHGYKRVMPPPDDDDPNIPRGAGVRVKIS